MKKRRTTTVTMSEFRGYRHLRELLHAAEDEDLTRLTDEELCERLVQVSERIKRMGMN